MKHVREPAMLAEKPVKTFMYKMGDKQSRIIVERQYYYLHNGKVQKGEIVILSTL